MGWTLTGTLLDDGRAVRLTYLTPEEVYAERALGQLDGNPALVARVHADILDAVEVAATPTSEPRTVTADDPRSVLLAAARHLKLSYTVEGDAGAPERPLPDGAIP